MPWKESQKEGSTETWNRKKSARIRFPTIPSEVALVRSYSGIVRVQADFRAQRSSDIRGKIRLE